MKNIPEEVIRFVRNEMEEYDCADNMRIRPVNATIDEIADYEVSRAGGCCGFVDYQSFIYDGIEYLYGFNYGH